MHHGWRFRPFVGRRRSTFHPSGKTTGAPNMQKDEFSPMAFLSTIQSLYKIIISHLRGFSRSISCKWCRIKDKKHKVRQQSDWCVSSCEKHGGIFRISERRSRRLVIRKIWRSSDNSWRFHFWCSFSTKLMFLFVARNTRECIRWVKRVGNCNKLTFSYKMLRKWF